MGVLSKTTSEIEDALEKADNIEATFDTMFTQKMLSIYPVGAIYMSASSTSPASLFGGTWEQIQNRFLLAAGSSYAAGNTGGEATHTLTKNEMPTHSHEIYSGYGDIVSNVSDAYRYQTWGSSDRGWKTGNLGTSNIGGGKAHNNMPPYLAVYVWKRTA